MQSLQLPSAAGFLKPGTAGAWSCCPLWWATGVAAWRLPQNSLWVLWLLGGLHLCRQLITQNKMLQIRHWVFARATALFPLVDFWPWLALGSPGIDQPRHSFYVFLGWAFWWKSLQFMRGRHSLLSFVSTLSLKAKDGLFPHFLFWQAGHHQVPVNSDAGCYATGFMTIEQPKLEMLHVTFVWWEMESML